jgi:hypothetical protein
VVTTRTFLVALALLLAAPIVAPAAADPPTGGSGNLTIAPNFVETVVRCAPTAHYVPLRRALNGQWVKGHCVPNGPGNAPARPAQ